MVTEAIAASVALIFMNKKAAIGTDRNMAVRKESLTGDRFFSVNIVAKVNVKTGTCILHPLLWLYNQHLIFA